MLTVGLAAMFKGLLLLFSAGISMSTPNFCPKAFLLKWGAIQIPSVYMATFIIGILFLILFGFFFKYSSQGIYMRSVADNQPAALSLGVHVRRVFALSWAIAALVCAMSGIVLGIINGINVHELSCHRPEGVSGGHPGRAGQYRRRHPGRRDHRSAGDLYRRVYLHFPAGDHSLYRPGLHPDGKTLRAFRAGGNRTGLIMRSRLEVKDDHAETSISSLRKLQRILPSKS